MAFDLYSFEYLKSGSTRQRRAYDSLAELDILRRLRDPDDTGTGLGDQPALAGSVPLDLALDTSDLEVVTFSADLRSFSRRLQDEFGSFAEFQSSRGIVLGVATLITRFRFAGEAYQIFTQNILVPRQSAVVHLLVEERLLAIGGPGLRERVWLCRLEGLKTEPAFGAILGLDEPYRELLDLEDLSDDEIRARFTAKF